MLSWLESLQKNWDTISQFPWLFASTVVISFSAGFAVAKYLSSEKMQSMNEAKKLAEDRVADYKEKLQGASPDQAQEKINSLEARVLALEPIKLTDEQLSLISDTLKKTMSYVVFELDASCPEMKILNQQLATVFSDAGWNVTGASVLGVSDRPKSGIGIGYKFNNSHISGYKEVLEAFKRAGIRCDILPSASSGFGESPRIRILLTSSY
ncbi:hypothetical protein HWX16_23200 [Ochrobactrum intermedium]|uniref:hypothetical protein n=1 Tax=Brucella intermedia TaxID=94625 RepID=UPI00159C6F1C|nr:hypothetical protein [Brucella intermedia]NVM43194.1 hypothetical protein [Brucella intermedia]